MTEKMNTYRTRARIFGVFFLIAFLAYGTGSALIGSIVSAPDILSNVYASTTLIVVGAILMGVIHTFTNIGLPVVLRPVLEPRNETLYFGYLSAAIVATVILVVGVIFLLLLLPLSDAYMRAGSAVTGQAETLAILLREANYYSYQFGMAIWSLGGLMFCSILYQSRLIPRLMSVWGVVGYTVFLSGCILAIFGLDFGLIHTAPGALFEVFLSLWLIVKGFNTSAFASESANPDDDVLTGVRQPAVVPSNGRPF
jgi:Domain of unknown function (DUF4386)